MACDEGSLPVRTADAFLSDDSQPDLSFKVLLPSLSLSFLLGRDDDR